MKKLIRVRCLMFCAILIVVLARKDLCAGSERLAADYLEGRLNSIPAQITLATLSGKMQLQLDDDEYIQSLDNIFKGTYQFMSSETSYRTRKGYVVNIFFKDNTKTSFLLYTTDAPAPVWRIAYMDPNDPGERLILSVKPDVSAIPVSLRAKLAKISLLSSDKANKNGSE